MQRTREAISNANPNTREGAEEAGRRGRRAQRGRLPAAAGSGRRAGAAVGLGPRRGDRADGRARPAAGRTRAAGRRPASDGGQWRDPGAAPQNRATASGRSPRRCRSFAARVEHARARARWPTRPRTSRAGSSAGRLDRQLVERQERLFRRMLDAGRTLQGKRGGRAQGAAEHDGDRRQRPSAAGAARSPAGRRRSPAGSHRGKSCSSFSPEERRLVVDYFRRLSEGPGR